VCLGSEKIWEITPMVPMGSASDAAEAVLALAFGGFFLILIGSSVSDTLSNPLFLDFRVWGAIYLVVAGLLAIGVVYGFLRSIVN
jgi:hypothetical protein